jgi:hypothetical protein
MMCTWRQRVCRQLLLSAGRAGGWFTMVSPVLAPSGRRWTNEEELAAVGSGNRQNRQISLHSALFLIEKHAPKPKAT